MTTRAHKGFNEDGSPRIVEVTGAALVRRQAEEAEFLARKSMPALVKRDDVIDEVLHALADHPDFSRLAILQAWHRENSE